MEQPPVVIETSVATEKDGATRFTEKQTRPGPDDRSDWLLMRTSRPIRDDETCEDAAADSMAFSPEASRPPHNHYHFGGLLEGVTAYSCEFPDGSSRYVSISGGSSTRNFGNGLRRPPVN